MVGNAVAFHRVAENRRLPLIPVNSVDFEFKQALPQSGKERP